MQNTVVYINGKWTKQSEATIPFIDGGFLYGDGVFETIRYQNRKLFRPERHLSRLNEGMEIIQMKSHFSDDEIINLLNESIDRNEMDSGLIRLMITRGSITDSPWNHTGPVSLFILVKPRYSLPVLPVKVVYLEERKYPIIRYTPAIKSMNYVGNMLAKRDTEAMGAYEPIFVNTEGYITECAIRNVFYIRDNTLITPALELGALPGVTREAVIEVAKNINFSVEELSISQKEINSMDEAFLSSTGAGILPCVWDGWNSDFKLTNQLINEFKKIQ